MRQAGVVLLAAVALLGFFAARGATESPDPIEALGLVRLDGGVRAPDFVLPDLDGRPVSLDSAAGSTTLLVFWATW